MAERKVLSKYFPPDFDPSKIKRTKKDPTKQQVVRLMAPFSMMCKSCGEYIYKGRKFNARKEVVVGEDYFGIKILRFYIKCTRCSAEITFKTDPKNTDYAMEHGATRNYQPWLDGEERKRKEEDPLAYLAEDELARQEEEEAGGRGGALGGSSSSRTRDNDNDPMASLEARQEESQREMAILDELQDIRTRNAKMDRVHTDGDLLDRLDKKRRRVDADANANAAETIEEMERRKAEEEDEQLVRKYFSRQPQQVRMPMDGDAGTDADGQQQQQQQRMHTVKRALHEKEPEPRELLSARAAALLGGSSTTTTNGSGSSVKSHAKAKPTESSPPSTEQASSSSSYPSSSSSAPAAPVAATSSTTTTAPTSTPSSITSHSSAKTAAMAGMAARKNKDKKKANALGLVQKKVK